MHDEEIVSSRKHVMSLNLETATDDAVEAILGARERFRAWVEGIRPQKGPMGRFHWAIEHTRDASIPSTGYALGAMEMMGLFDEVVTDADRLLDSGFEYFYQPDHDEKMNSCSEWDALMVMRELQPLTGENRAEELKKLAAHRIVRIVQLVQQSDGGFSATRTCCTTSFVGFDMAPPILQGDVHAGIFAQAIGECVDILGIQERSRTPGMNRRPSEEDADLRRRVREAVAKAA